ncbi:hypothetical protein PJP06_29250, partial [Mycobacterium kansasii]
ATSPEIVDLVRNIRERTLETRKRVIAIYQAHLPQATRRLTASAIILGRSLPLLALLRRRRSFFPIQSNSTAGLSFKGLKPILMYS